MALVTAAGPYTGHHGTHGACLVGSMLTTSRLTAPTSHVARSRADAQMTRQGRSPPFLAIPSPPSLGAVSPPLVTTWAPELRPSPLSSVSGEQRPGGDKHKQAPPGRQEGRGARCDHSCQSVRVAGAATPDATRLALSAGSSGPCVPFTQLDTTGPGAARCPLSFTLSGVSGSQLLPHTVQASFTLIGRPRGRRTLIG